MRYKFLRYLNKISNTLEGSIPPKWVRILRYVLFPLHWFYANQSGIKYDYATNIYTIRGIEFSGQLLEAFGDAKNNGLKFQLITDGKNATLKTIR